jgi:hypothetical protein
MLQHANPFLSNDSLKTPVARQQIPNKFKWTGWKAVFPARSAPMAEHAIMDTATKGRCFLCGPCLDVIPRTIRRASSVELSIVEWSKLVSSQFADCYSSVVVSCCCEKLSPVRVRESRVRGKPAVGSRYRATASEDVTVDTSLHVIVIYKVQSRVV